MPCNTETVEFESLKGVTLSKIEGLNKGSCEVCFTSSEGRKFKMHHAQDCCESVEIEDVCGDVSDLIGSPIALAECVSNAPKPADTEQEDGESDEWTFYKLVTLKGAVTIRWFGTSNGYYSTSVDFVEV